MAHKQADRVRETTATAGTGPFTLLGAVNGFVSFFSAAAEGDTIDYVRQSATGLWEIGVGTITSPTTMARRDPPWASSQGGALVAFGASTDDIFLDLPAARLAAMFAEKATEAYVNSRGFITSAALNGYATETYVNGRGFITSSTLTPYALKTYVDSKITDLIGGAPAALDTLIEISNKLASDDTVTTNLINSVATKVPIDAPRFTGDARVSSPGPAYQLNVTNGAFDQKFSDIYADGTGVFLRFVNDAYNAATTWIQATRSGFGILAVKIWASTEIVGTLGINNWLAIRGGNGTQRTVFLQTGVSNRWGLRCDEGGETGGNAGSSFAVDRYGDNGAYLGTPLYIVRSTGKATFSSALQADATFDTYGTVVHHARTEIETNFSDFEPGENSTLVLRGTATGHCNISFHIPGVFASKIGYSSDGMFHIGGWSHGKDRWKLDGSGNSFQDGRVNNGDVRAQLPLFVNAQGAYLQWNRDGGRTFLINQRGAGNGGLSFGEVTTNNVYTENATINSDGNSTFRLSVFAGQQVYFGANFPANDFSQWIGRDGIYNVYNHSGDGWRDLYNRQTGERAWVGVGEAIKMFLGNTGNLVTGGTVNGVSDKRAKNGIKDLEVTSAMDFVKFARSRKFKMNDDPSGKELMGFIADEIEAIPSLSHLVGEIEFNGEKIKTLDAGHGMASLLLIAVQELTRRIDKLDPPKK